MWWKTSAGEYLNSANVTAVTTEGAGSSWYLVAYIPGSVSGYQLAGTWSTEAQADSAVQKLVQGFDPSGL